MTITAICQSILSERSARLVRYRSGGKGEPKEYDTRDLFGGNRRGWTLLDMTTANAIMTVHRGLREDLRVKLDTIPLRQLVDFCWRAVA